MNPLFAAFSLFCAVSAPAQVLRAPALGRSVLPGLSGLSAVPSGLAAAARPTLAPAAALTPVLTIPALPAALPAQAVSAAAPAQTPRAVLEAASVALARSAENPAGQAAVLSGLFEGRSAGGSGVVVADAAIPQPTRLAPAYNAARPAAEPAPPAPARPVWKTAGLYALRAAGFLGALYGGFRVGDLAYLGLEGLGGLGLAVSLPLLGAAAWWLGGRQNASPLGRAVMAGLFASAGFTVVGQQVWDLFHSPLGLFVGVPIGIVLALVASGFIFRRKKFTGEPSNLSRP